MRVTEDRRGRPDYSQAGRARQVDLGRATRNDLRQQVGTDWDRLQVPSWTTNERPTTPLLGDVGFNETKGNHEGYDGTDWSDLTGGASINETFTATASYTYTHSLGQNPDVSVRLENGTEILVEVLHPDTNTVTINFNGTITNGVLILS